MTDLSARGTAPRVVERRDMPFRAVELRAKPDGSGGESLVFCGYASVTESAYEMHDWLGPFNEVIRRGAFKKTLSDGADVAFLVNHAGLTMARTKSGTLRLSEDDTGLYSEADLDPRSPSVAELRTAMERHDIDEMSFAFQVIRQQWSPDFDQRDILEVSLNKGDVSVVNYGANPATAGAQLDARAVAASLAQLDTEQRRDVYERLVAEFNKSDEPPTNAAPLALYAARARALDLAPVRPAGP